MTATIICIVAAIVIVLLTSLAILSRYVKCEPNELLIMYGKSGGAKSCTVKHGGAAFVWPIIQGYKKMSMAPIQFTETIEGLSAQNIITTIPVTLTTAISRDATIMQNAAERFLNTSADEIKRQLKQILIGGIREIMATMLIEEINADRGKFLEKATENIETQLNKFGYTIMNININDIKDAAQVIENRGKRAATQAQAQAQADIAEERKRGAIKIAETEKEQAIAIAEATKIKDTKVAETNKLKETSIAATQKEKNVQLATIEKENAVAVAEQEKEQEVGVATAMAEKESLVAKQESIQVANVAMAEAEAESKKAEAEANKQVRIMAAQQNQQAENVKAQQEKEAKAAEYKSNSRKRAAEAEKQAGVAEQQATIEVSKAKGEAKKAEAEAAKVAGLARVEAEMEVEKSRNERQIEVNEAAAKAREVELKAAELVPAETEKKRLIIEAEAAKAQAILEAEAEKQRILKEAEADAERVRLTMEAEAEGKRKVLLAEAEGKRASLMAEADQARALAEAPSMALVKLQESGINPSLLVELKTVERIEGLAEVQTEALKHVNFKEMVVYGDENLGAKVISGLAKTITPVQQILSHTPAKKFLSDVWNGKEETSSLPADVENANERDTFETVD